jgi:hypothetical protein
MDELKKLVEAGACVTLWRASAATTLPPEKRFSVTVYHTLAGIVIGYGGNVDDAAAAAVDLVRKAGGLE